MCCPKVYHVQFVPQNTQGAVICVYLPQWKLKGKMMHINPSCTVCDFSLPAAKPHINQ